MVTTKSFEEIIVRSKELKANPKPKRLPVKQSVTLPVKGGRQTIPESLGTLGGFLSEIALIEPEFNLELLKALENLSIYNPDLSQAVENVVSLGNTLGDFPSNIVFDDAVGESQAKEMISRLKIKSKDWYAYSGGLNSLVNDLLSQVAINGALSAESVPSLALDGVHKIVKVAPKAIKFKYDNEKDEYIPFQIPANYTLGNPNNLGIELNTVTYSYIGHRRLGEKPYGIPPFLSALNNIAISNELQQNMKFIIKKLGVLGFLEVLVNAPKPNSGETEEQYFDRTKLYLDKVTPEVEKGLSKGFVSGFKGMHEFNMHPTTAHVQGAKDIIEMNDVRVMSGMKQDPLMFGRNFNTSETLGRVILAKMTKSIANYQQIVSSFLNKVFLLDLQLAGFSVNTVEVTFDPPMIGDKKKDQETRKLEIDNARSLYNDGIISQQQRAVELGYEKADQDEPRMSDLSNPLVNSDPDNNTNPDKEKTISNKKSKKKKKKKSTYESSMRSLGGHLPEYDYGHGAGCNCESHSFADDNGDDPELDAFIKAYLSSTVSVYDKAVDKTIRQIGNRLSQLGVGASEAQISDAIIGTIFSNWGNNFSKPQRKIVDKFVKSVYRFFRSDDSVFNSISEVAVPKSSFSSLDLRAIEYYKKSDSLYLGKFVTDADLRKRMTAYIKENYINNKIPLGTDSENYEHFKKTFGNLFAGQEWKLSRIIKTTVNKMRNTAALSYINQAEISTFQIVGVNDRLQCPYCKELQGKTFSVETSFSQINEAVKSDPELVGVDTPFVNSIFKNVEDMKGLSSEELQSRGIGLPPFHANCRDTIIAVL